ncbi:MAG: hypothetical protein H6773_04055 [Pseudomonadales bacterium]|nr:hypothetical protein [Pseudomonadales bacterium]
MKPGGPNPSGMQMRPGGGFNAAPGGLSEHMDEAALQQAMGAKAQAQQSGTISPQQMAQAAAQKSQQQQPREMGTIGEEVKRMGSDVVVGLKEFFSFATWFGFDPKTMTPEEQQKLKTVHQNFQNLDEQQQRYVQERFQKEQQRKKMMEEEAARRKQEDEAASSEVIMPSSPQKGAQGPGGGSKKKQATQMLQDKRKKMSGPGDIN